MPQVSQLFSILMPVHNAEKYLSEAIESALAQSYQHIELICIDDNSSDSSLSIIEKYASSDFRIKYTSIKNGGTAARARNAGLPLCSGVYIAMLDSDDIISRDYIEKAVLRIQSTGADILIPDLLFKNQDLSLLKNSIIGFNGDRTAILNNKEALIASLNWSISGVSIIESKLLKKIGYDPEGMNGDEYTTRLLFINSQKIAFTEGQYYYRIHSNSTTKKFNLRSFETLITDCKILKLLMAECIDQRIIQGKLQDFISTYVDKYVYYLSIKSKINNLERKYVKDIFNTSLEMSRSFEFYKILNDTHSINKKIRIKLYLFFGIKKNSFLCEFYLYSILIVINVRNLLGKVFCFIRKKHH